jgi:hypothetical protein
MAITSACNKQDFKGSDTKNYFTDTLSYNIQADSGYSAAITIQNTDTNRIYFRFSVNDKIWFTPKDMINYIRNMESDSIIGTHRYISNAFNFVANNTAHTKKIPLGKKYRYSPGIFINSLGTGLCDNRGTVLALIWRELGFESRCVHLGGHLVPEVKDNDKWKLLDPDYYSYFLYDGEIASVDQIANKSNECELIINEKTYNCFSKSIPYLYTLFFKTADNNEVQDWYMQGIEWNENEFCLPPNASLSFPKSNPNSSKNTPYTFACMHLTNFVGFIDIPFAVHSISGDGSLFSFIQGNVTNHSSTNFFAPDTYFVRSKDLYVYMYINENLLSQKLNTELKIISNNSHVLKISNSKFNTPSVKTKWLKDYTLVLEKCSLLYEELFKKNTLNLFDTLNITNTQEFVNACSDFYKKSRNTNSIPDSISLKIKYTIEALETHNIDSTQFFDIIENSHSRNIFMILLIELPNEAMDETFEYYSHQFIE